LDAYYGPPDGEAITGEAFKGVPPEGNLITKNICFGKWDDITWHAKKEWFDIRDNYVTDDLSGVGSPETGLQIPTEPSWANGFEAIPFDKIGLENSGGREYIPRLLNSCDKKQGILNYIFMIDPDKRMFEKYCGMISNFNSFSDTPMQGLTYGYFRFDIDNHILDEMLEKSGANISWDNEIESLDTGRHDKFFGKSSGGIYSPNPDNKKTLSWWQPYEHVKGKYLAFRVEKRNHPRVLTTMKVCPLGKDRAIVFGYFCDL